MNFLTALVLWAAVVAAAALEGVRHGLTGRAFITALLLARGAGKAPGTWEDYAAMILLWVPVEFLWMDWLFPYPPILTHTLTILMALGTGVATFILLRRLEGVGYGAEWRSGFGWNSAVHFVIYAAIAAPLGIKIGFITFDPAISRMRASLPLEALGILLFTAWPEEFLFRGLLQNLLSRTVSSRWVGLIAASAIFGLSHIFHAPYPNWKYVLLATIAGLFYGHVWMKTGSLVPGVLVHALVDISWHVLFR
jgi:membrane protease YdiL (CAAX protease family)